ncbi:MAG: DUF1232 domain-containing protein [Humibacillus sp.]|nr:DUF1232 domain-containing protein [Humibacillus sp.]MDN5776113.1 DUF1232 domain-containing protein [Humibacillus sp.]
MKKTSRLKLAATVFAVARASGEPGSPGFLERAQCVPRLVHATLDRSYTGVTPGRLALVAAAAAYVASPVDLVPESVLPIIGLADDALVLRWALHTFVEETDRFLIWEARRYAWRPGGRTRRTQPAQTTAAPAAPDRHAPGDTVPPRPDRDATGAAAPGGDPAAGVRDAARAYLLESVRRRLER